MKPPMRPYLALIIVCTLLAFGVPLAVAYLDREPRIELAFDVIQKMAGDPALATKIKYLQHAKEGDIHWVYGEFTEPITSWPAHISPSGKEVTFNDSPIVRFRAIPIYPAYDIKLPNGKTFKYP